MPRFGFEEGGGLYQDPNRGTGGDRSGRGSKRNYGPAGDISFRQQGEVGRFYGGYDPNKTIQSRGTGAYSQGTGRRGATGPSPPTTGSEEEVIFKETPIQVTQQGPNIMDDASSEPSLNLNPVNTAMTKPSVPDTIVSDDVEDSVNNYVDAQTAGFSSGAGGAVGNIGELQNMLTAYQGRGTLIQGRTAQKSVYTIDRFDGGLNTSFNPRDLSYWQACSMDELSPSKIGRLVRLGDFKSSAKTIASTTLQSSNHNYGHLYANLTTQLSGNDALATSSNTVTSYVTVLNDNGSDAEIIDDEKNRIFDEAASDWTAYNETGSAASREFDASYDRIKIIGTSATTKQGIQLPNDYLTNEVANVFYEVSFDIETDRHVTDTTSGNGYINNFSVHLLGRDSDSFSVTTERKTYKITIQSANSTGVLRIHYGNASTVPWYVYNVSVKRLQGVSLYENDTDYILDSMISSLGTGCKPSMYFVNNKLYCSDSNFSTSTSKSYMAGIKDRPSLFPIYSEDMSATIEYNIDGSTGSQIIKNQPMVHPPPVGGRGHGQVMIAAGASTDPIHKHDGSAFSSITGTATGTTDVYTEEETQHGIFIQLKATFDTNMELGEGWGPVSTETGTTSYRYYKFFASFLYDDGCETTLTDVTSSDNHSVGERQKLTVTYDGTNDYGNPLGIHQVIIDADEMTSNFPRVNGARFYYQEYTLDTLQLSPIGEDKYLWAELDFQKGLRLENSGSTSWLKFEDDKDNESTVSFQDATVISGDATVTVGNTFGIVVGMTVAGTHIQSDTKVSSITNGTELEMTKTATGSASSHTLLFTFKDRLTSALQVHGAAKTLDDSTVSAQGKMKIDNPPTTFTFFDLNLFNEIEIKEDLQWKCSTLGNGVSFIGNIKYDGVEHPDVVLYCGAGESESGSAQAMYSLYPVLSNRIHIPSSDAIITALLWNGGLLFQFRRNTLFIINVTDLTNPTVQSSHQGMGVHGQHAVTLTPFGVAWVNDGGVYSYNIEKKAVRSLTVGRIESEEFSSGLVNCSITGYSIASSAKTVTYTCSANHNLSVGEKVSVTGVTGTNGKNDSDFSSPYVSALGGSPNEDTQFTMKLTTAPVSDPSDSGLTGTLKCIGHSDTKIGYDDRSKMLIIGNHLKSNTKGYHYAYSLVSDSWCTWEANKVSFSPTSNYSIDKDGYLTGFIYADGSNDNISRWSVTPNTTGVVEYITKDIDMGKPSINKRLFTLYISYTGGTGQSDMYVYFRINGMYGSDTDSGWTRLQTIQDYTNPYGSNSGSAWATTGTPTTGDAVIPTTDDLDSTDTSDVQKLAKINLRHLVSSDGNHDDTVVNSTLPKDYLKFARSIQFKIAGTASATFEINDITLVYKDKIIK